MNLLLDTNVLIDHFGERPDFAKDAHIVFALALFGDATLWATSNSFTDVFYVLRCGGANPGAIQRAFARSFSVLKVCNVGADDLARACELQWDDMEDCLVSACAEKLHADYIVTRDTKGFAASAVPAIHPRELLEQLRREQRLHYDLVDDFGAC